MFSDLQIHFLLWDDENYITHHVSLLALAARKLWTKFKLPRYKFLIIYSPLLHFFKSTISSLTVSRIKCFMTLQILWNSRSSIPWLPFHLRCSVYCHATFCESLWYIFYCVICRISYLWYLILEIYISPLFSLSSLSVVVQSLSCVYLRPHELQVNCSTPGFPLLHISLSLLKLMSIESFNHLILCLPLLLLTSIFPNIRVFPNESTLRIRWPKYWSFSFSPSNE